MKIFVIGQSNSGKTSFSKKLAEALGAVHIPISEWVRSRFPEFNDGVKSDERVEIMTKFSINALKRDPAVAVNFLRHKHDLSKPCAIEGIRNPSDFMQLFDYTSDFVIFIENKNNHIKFTGFERGVHIIESYLGYLLSNGLMDDSKGKRFSKYSWDCFSEEERLNGTNPCLKISLEGAVHAFLNTHPELKNFKPAPVQKDVVHMEIAPIRAFVKEEFLYNLDGARKGGLLPCSIFAISSYPGSAPTFKILIDGGYAFSYIPIHALLASNEVKSPQLEHGDLVYHNCPMTEICVNRFDTLAKSQIRAYFKTLKIWLKAKYLLTVDWYMGNDLLHLLELENGQFAMLPHHKVRFADSTEPFPHFKKLKYEWRVGEEEEGKPKWK